MNLKESWEVVSNRSQKIKPKLSDKLGDLGQILLIGFLFIFGYIIEYVWTLILVIVKFPRRVICKARGEHDWIDYGSGGFIFPGPKYRFQCKCCGTRSKGDWESLLKKGFKGTARIK